MKHQRIICFGDSITNPADLPVNFHWPSDLHPLEEKLGLHKEKPEGSGSYENRVFG
jgi:hypothetical protein